MNVPSYQWDDGWSSPHSSWTAHSIPDIRWPGSATVAVSVTVDVDGTALLDATPETSQGRTTLASQAQFGLTRGIERILRLLDQVGVVGTFYVPGITARNYPETVRRIASGGHDIGHHGDLHLDPSSIDADAQATEVERGIRSLESLIGEPPTLYRAPYWNVTDHTLELLTRYGVVADSSLMGDDRPYVVRHARGSLFELPVQWALDDGPFFAWATGVGSPYPPLGLADTWCMELDQARRDGGHLSITVEPALIGRRHRFAQFEEFVRQAAGADDVWLCSHGQMVAYLQLMARDRNLPDHA